MKETSQKYRLIIPLTILLMWVPFSDYAQSESGLDRISSEQKAYELSVLWKEMDYNFGNFNNCDEIDLDSLYRAYLPKVKETKNDFEYWKTLQCFMAHFNNGHTRIFGAPDYFLKHLAYPLLETSFHGGIVTIENYGARLADQLNVGDTILTINGKDALTYFQEKQVPFVTASNEEYKMHESMFYYGNINCCLNYNDAEYHLGVKTPDGKKDVVVKADYYLDPEKRNQNDLFYTGGKYWRTQNHFAIDTTNSFAFIALTACNQGFQDHFMACYDDIQKVDNLIVDISYNGGGYSAFCDSVLEYLVNCDSICNFRTLIRASNAGEKASEYFEQDASKETEIELSNEREYYLNHTFENPNFHESEYRTNSIPESQRYQGKVYVVISHETISAAEYFAVMLSQNKKVVFLGEKTAGANAQPYYFVLPSGIKAMINTGRCYDFENNEISSGFMPDYELDMYGIFRRKSRKHTFQRLIDLIKDIPIE